MTEHLKVEESFVEALIEQAAWTAAKVGIVEKAKVKEQDDEEEVPVKEKKASKKPDPKFKPKKGAKVTQGSNYDDDGKPTSVQDRDPEDTMAAANEDTEVHECPLCESVLEEELSDEQIREHVAQIQAAIATIEEGGDDDDDGPEPTDDDLDAIEKDPVKLEKKKSKKESVMKKVKELKKASKGK